MVYRLGNNCKKDLTRWGHNGSLAGNIAGLAFPSEFRGMESQRENIVRNIGLP